MRKLTLMVAVISGLLWACGEDEKPAEPTPNSALIIGKWQSQQANYKTTINGQSVSRDSIIDSFFLTFTSNNFVYIDYDGILDTSRYNFEGDTLYFIENARAYDTLFINLLDEANLKLVTEKESGNVGGNIFSYETIVDFIKLSE